jgi:hypothetical protein
MQRIKYCFNREQTFVTEQRFFLKQENIID